MYCYGIVGKITKSALKKEHNLFKYVKKFYILFVSLEKE